MRLDYETKGIVVDELSDEPIEQFRRWLDDAVAAGVHEPNAMVVSTVDAEGRPWSRYVLLKGLEAGGFDFYTNYDSLKSQQLAVSPHAAVTFGWLDLHRQVNISGSVVRISDEESDAYWRVRTRGSQIGGWASNQSTELPDRQALLDRYARMEERFADPDGDSSTGDPATGGTDGNPVPRPPHWGGWRVVPHTVEFWQGRRNRLHDRLRYRSADDGTWERVRLSP